MTDYEILKRMRRCSYFSRIGVLALTLLFFATTAAFAQNATVRGKVIDGQTNEGIPGVNVIQKGTTNGTVTNLDGEYEFTVPENALLIFSFIGYTPQEIKLNGQSQLDVSLMVDSQSLDEVIAIGYGGVKRSNLTGAVSSISGAELSKIPITNAAEAIKGRIPGVNVMTTDGSPDAEIVIRVRGGNSVTQDNSPLFVVDGFIVSSIRDIPPSDITSLNVLKDAAATAIYGAQAANGVIIITTKSPTAGKTEVSYNGFVKYKQLPSERKLQVLDPYEYVLAQYEYAKIGGDASLRNFEKFYGKYDDLELYNYKKGTDWQDEIFGNRQMSQSHNVSATGGTEKTKLSLSISNNTDQGLMTNNAYNQTSVNFKLNHEIAKSLKLDVSARITNTDVDGKGTSGGSQLRLKDIVTARPVNGIADELDIDLNSIDASDDYQSFLLRMLNPVELAEQDWRKRMTNKYVINAGLTWTPVTNLVLKTTFTDSRTFDESLRYYGPKTGESQKEGNSLPLGTTSKRQSFSYRVLNTAQYVVPAFGDHNVDVLLGHEVYSSGSKGNFVRAEDFRESMQPEELFANFVLGTPVSSSSFVATNSNRVSFFGRLNYAYADRYLATFTLRSDASSKFAQENRLGLFPSLALAWKLSETTFIKDLGLFSELKFRVSLGTTGNDRIPTNATKFLFDADNNNGPGMGTNQINAYYKPDGSTLYNPGLVWETTVNRNLGLDFQMFNRRLNGAFDVYKNTTTDLLLQSAISPISGFPTQWDNVGSTLNQGIELSLDANVIDQDDFQISVNANFGLNQAQIVELDGTEERFIRSNWASTDLKDRDDYYLAVGKSIGLVYGYVNDGMYSVDDFESYDEASGEYILKDGVPNNGNTLGVSSLRPGYMKLKDLNNDSLINSLDREVIGSTLPKAFGGFGASMSLKGFDLNVMFNWMVGNDVYNSSKIEFNQFYRTASSFGNILASQSSDKRFTYIDLDGTYTGTPGEVVTDLEQLRQMNEGKTTWNGPNSFGGATAVVSDWGIENASFLRLSTLTLGYTVPRNFASKIGMSNLRVYVSGYNLWVWTNYSGYDPEVSTSRSSSYSGLISGLDYSAYPRSRSVTFGVNVRF